MLRRARLQHDKDVDIKALDSPVKPENDMGLDDHPLRCISLDFARNKLCYAPRNDRTFIIPQPAATLL